MRHKFYPSDFHRLRLAFARSNDSLVLTTSRLLSSLLWGIDDKPATQLAVVFSKIILLNRTESAVLLAHGNDPATIWVMWVDASVCP